MSKPAKHSGTSRKKNLDMLCIQNADMLLYRIQNSKKCYQKKCATLLIIFQQQSSTKHENHELSREGARAIIA